MTPYKLSKLILGGSLVVFGLSTFVLQSRPDPTEIAFKHSQFHEQLQNETVIVETGEGWGSGVVVQRHDKTFVWTAAHVTKGYSKVKVTQKFRFNGIKAGSQTFPAYVVARLTGVDASLLWVWAPPGKLTGAEWAEETPAVGSQILCVSNMRGGDNFDGSVTEGIISQVGVSPVLPGWPWANVDQATCATMHGSSGGPVFARYGKVIGLIVGGVDSSGVACYTPLRDIYAAARTAKVTWAIYGVRAVPPSDSALEGLVLANVGAPPVTK